ncbi:MAG: 3-methyladenine DNA glycosylase [Roseibacillus sp.]
MPHPPFQYLTAPAVWQPRADAHRQALAPITSAYRKRKAQGTLHPVHDFLFSYYSYTAGKLEQWHPAVGETLALDASSAHLFTQRHYRRDGDAVTLDVSILRPKDLERLRFSRRLLELTASRPPNFGCYGLHEWAMVYQSDNPRHRERAPLRLSPEEIARFVKSQPLACSHFDAVRFFTPAALPLNRLQPSLMTREDFEQPGCVHANMDLYKWSFKAMPWVGSDLLRKTFMLALELRELDMRASPYDLSEYGYHPIAIETSAGRAKYVKIQQLLANRAASLRVEVMKALDSLFEQVTISSSSPSI